MARLSIVIISIILSACSANKPQQNTGNTETSNDESYQLEVRIIKVEEDGDKFKLTGVCENETGVNSYSAGDTLLLLPNFVRKEGMSIQMDDPENKKMLQLRNMSKNKTLKATVKFRGAGKKQHGLIMDWSEK